MQRNVEEMLVGLETLEEAPQARECGCFYGIRLVYIHPFFHTAYAVQGHGEPGAYPRMHREQNREHTAQDVSLLKAMNAH